MSPSPIVAPANLSIRQVMVRTGLGRSRCLELMHAGAFGKPLKNGKKYLVSADRVERFIRDWQAGRISIPSTAAKPKAAVEKASPADDQAA